MGMLIKGLGGPLDGQVVVESPDGKAQPEVLVPDKGKGRRIGRYGLMLAIPPGEGPVALVYQWKGWVA
jgi:hypothetical protein